MKPLCGYHAQTLRLMRRNLPHLTGGDRKRIAHDLWRQCCQGPLVP